MNQEKIGKFIAELRKGKNLTQEELAHKLGITKNAVSKWAKLHAEKTLKFQRKVSFKYGIFLKFPQRKSP